MIPLSQRASLWKNNRLGTCPDETFGSAGCKLFSLCMAYSLDPIATNQLFIDKGVYSSGCKIDDSTAARVLGVKYEGKTTAYQNSICIAETNHYENMGIPQHFFVWLGNGRIIDPLNGTEKNNSYKIISFRLFRPKEESMEWSRFHEINIEVLRKVRNQLFGKVDNVACEADGKQVDLEVQNGDNYALANKVLAYLNSKEFNEKWVKASVFKELEKEQIKIMEEQDVAIKEIDRAYQRELTKRDNEIAKLKKDCSVEVVEVCNGNKLTWREYLALFFKSLK